MQEVQAVCDRVLIINQGKLVADDPIDRLQARLQGEIRITAEWLTAVAPSALQKIPGVQRVQALNEKRVELFTASEIDIRPALFQFSVDQKLVLVELHQERSSMEQVFHQLTQSKSTQHGYAG